MKIITLLVALLFLWIDHVLKIRNSILLMELMFLAAFYFGGRYLTSTLGHKRKKRAALRADRGYRNPKEVKTWQSYQSRTEVQRTKEPTYFDIL